LCFQTSELALLRLSGGVQKVGTTLIACFALRQGQVASHLAIVLVLIVGKLVVKVFDMNSSSFERAVEFP
jgi:hypothetical protein